MIYFFLPEKNNQQSTTENPSNNLRKAQRSSAPSHSTNPKKHSTRSPHIDELRRHAKQLAENDPKEGIRILEKLEGNERRVFASVFFKVWAESAPAECFACVSEWWEGDDLAFVNDTEVVAAIWASQNPLEASNEIYRYVQTLSQSSEFHSAYILVSAVGEWAHDQPDQAYQWLQQLPHDYTQGVALTTVIEHWAQKDPIAALRTSTDENTNSEERNLIYQAALSEWSRTDPSQSAQWLLKNIETKDLIHLEQTASNISQNFFNQADIGEITAWISQIQEPNIKESAVVTMASLWGNSERTNENLLGELATQLQESGDEAYGRGLYEATHSLSSKSPASVTNWLNQQDSYNSATDQVISAYLTAATNKQSFKDLFAWSQRLTERNLRDQQQYLLISRLNQQDKITHQEWIEQNGENLSPQTKNLLEQ